MNWVTRHRMRRAPEPPSSGCGISGATGIFWVEVPRDQRPKALIYVDTSPSMEDWAERTVYIIDRLKDDLPTRMYAFAGSVQECDTADFAKGNYYAGWSTYFDAVITHALEHEGELVIVITDGQSSVSAENKELFRKSGKRLFTILCGSRGDSRYNGLDLREIAEETMCLLTNPKRGR